MTSDELLVDAFGRIRDGVHRVVDRMSKEELAFRPDPEANPVGWIVWHLTRIQDDHIAGVAGTEQIWTKGGWAERFGLPYDAPATGYGHSSEEVGRFSVASAELLTAYLDAVHEATVRFLGTLDDADLDRVVDRSWDPPVTLGVRLVSVISDDLEHLGQAAYVKGMAGRR